jgi:hypothetical protein
MTDSELIKAFKEIDNAKEIYSLKKEQFENIEYDIVSKKGFLFFICIKENIQNDNWFNDIFNGYNILSKDLDPLYNQEEMDYYQNRIVKLGLILLDICEDYFVSDKINELEMSKRIDTIINIEEYILSAKIAKSLGITLNSTKENLGTFLSYFMSCYKQWCHIFPSELSHFKDFKKIFKINHPIEIPLGDVTFDKNIVANFFERCTILIINNRDTYSRLKNNESIDLDIIKRELINASYRVGFSSLMGNQELNSTAELLDKWIKLEEKFIEAIPHSSITNQSEQVLFKFKNNFDSTIETNVYTHFRTELIDKKYLSEKDFEKYLECAFQEQTPPKNKFTINNRPTDEKIRKIFYKFYKEIAGKPHGEQRKYATLLGEYFIGFDTQKVLDNFSK